MGGCKAEDNLIARIEFGSGPVSRSDPAPRAGEQALGQKVIRTKRDDASETRADNGPICIQIAARVAQGRNNGAEPENRGAPENAVEGAKAASNWWKQHRNGGEGESWKLVESRSGDARCRCAERREGNSSPAKARKGGRKGRRPRKRRLHDYNAPLPHPGHALRRDHLPSAPMRAQAGG